MEVLNKNVESLPPPLAELCRFGFLLAMILIVLFGLLLPCLKDRSIPLWPFFIGISIALLAGIRPAVLNVFYKAWMKFGAAVTSIRVLL